MVENLCITLITFRTTKIIQPAIHAANEVVYLARELVRFWTSQVRLLRSGYDTVETHSFDSKDEIQCPKLDQKLTTENIHTEKRQAHIDQGWFERGGTQVRLLSWHTEIV